VISPAMAGIVKWKQAMEMHNRETNMTRNRWTRNCEVLVLAATVCFSPAAMAATHIELKASPEINPTHLEVVDNDSQCAGGPIDCIEVPAGSGHNMFFDLDKACTADGPNYKLSAFRLAMKHKDWPTSSNPLSADIAGDFAVNPDDGYATWVSGDSTLSDSRIKIKNKNIKAYSVYYEITAVECNGTGEIKLDPVIRNGGGGNP
jgi:hypothetical protein